jgi:ketosteroid isomerase-like protein
MTMRCLVSLLLISASTMNSASAQTVSGIDTAKAAELFTAAQQATGSLDPAVTTIPAKLLQQYHEAQNRGDLAAVMALFADDATFVAAPLCLPSCTGKTQIQRAIEQRILDYNQQHLIDVQTNGNVATSRTDWRSDPTRKAGVDRRINIETVDERDGKIVRYTTRGDLSDPQTAKFQAFVDAAAARAKAAAAAKGIPQ